MSPRKLNIPEAELRVLMEKYSIQKIARILGWMPSTVSLRAKEYGIPPKFSSSVVTQKEIDHIHQRRAEGATMQEIAKELGRCLDFVQRHKQRLTAPPVSAPYLPLEHMRSFGTGKWPEYDRANEALIARAGGYGPRREQPCRSSSGGI